MAVSSDQKLSSPSLRILLVLGQTPFPVELIDDQYRVLYCNMAYAKTFLDSTTELLGRPSRVFPLEPADGRSRLDVMAQVRREGLWKGETVVMAADKRALPVRMRIFPIHEPGGGPEEYAIFYEDIREEVEAREALQHQQDLVVIRSRQAQMGELLSMIAHQWRQPLTVVMSLIGNIQLKAQLGAAIDPGYLQTKLERMAQTLHFLSETIDSFRDFHTPAKHKTAEDLVLLARKALDLVIPSLHNVGARVEFITPEPALLAEVFRGEFQQLVLELINNGRDALVASKVANPVLKVEILRSEGQALLRVGNNGAAIPASILSRIFEPYYSTKEAGSGSGLGLYMAKTIVESHHGGVISVDSDQSWTSFSSYFPLEGTA